MSSLREIRRHLKSIENIKKITDTMERVAAAQLRHAQIQMEQTRLYTSKIREILQHMVSLGLVHPLLEAREVRNKALIVISADRGLSGAYNANVLSTADNFIKENQNTQLILFGKKAVDHFARMKEKVYFQQMEWTDKFTLENTISFSQQLVEWFENHQFDEIDILYTKYLSFSHRKIVLEKLLPISDIEVTSKPKSFIFEPNLEEVLEAVLPRYSNAIVQTALHESHASELAARIIAMQTASKNSEEVIERLTLVKNKTRQQDITREMIEISTGANS